MPSSPPIRQQSLPPSANNKYKKRGLTALQTTIFSAKDTDKLAAAGALLRAGGLVAIPTETVYGLACSAFRPEAVARVFAAKGRPSDNPLIVHISDLSQLSLLWDEIPPEALRLAEAFWPGPLTMIARKRPDVPAEVTGGLDTVAVRFPAHPAAQAVINAAGVPLAAPSANLSGSPSPTCAEHVRSDLEGRIEMILDGGECDFGVESTVLDLTRRPFAVLRPGSVTPEMLRGVLSDVITDPAVLRPLDRGETARSPGMKYRHYAPQSPVTAVSGPGCGSAAYIRAHLPEGGAVLCFDAFLRDFARFPSVAYGAEADAASLARGLYASLRLLDREPHTHIFAQCPPLSEKYLAVTNRLCRSAGFRIIHVNEKGAEI
ncbi:MAG: threonylcarbamoyl-AMP synthase [Clostridia bacterium]|nr:threonylcarbamoyl-AMP synthase [Clostridia bacterium]